MVHMFYSIPTGLSYQLPVAIVRGALPACPGPWEAITRKQGACRSQAARAASAAGARRSGRAAPVPALRASLFEGTGVENVALPDFRLTHVRTATLNPFRGAEMNRKTLTIALSTFLLSIAFIALPAHGAEKKRILWGSSAAASSNYAYWVSVSQLINNKVDGVESTTAETGSTMDNLRRIQRGQVDGCQATSNVVYYAYNGMKQWEGKPMNLRALWSYAVSPQMVVVREDSGIKTLKDLSGKRINPGGKGSATESSSDDVMKALGYTPDWARGATGDMVDAIKDNRVKGFIKSGNGLKLDGSMQDIQTTSPIRCIGVTAEEEAIIAKNFPELPVVDIPEAGPGIPPFRTWAFFNVAITTPEFDEDMAYNIVKAVCEDKEIQHAAFAGIRGIDVPTFTLKYATIPLHPGAARYYKEIGLEIPAHLQPK